jgi:antirestriction protein ArdC
MKTVSTDRRDVYAIITERIIERLERGTVPWRKPWADGGVPRNLVSKKPYRGINYFLLSASKYVSPYWLTYKQAEELGGHVRKGEKSTLIVFWKVETRNDPDAQEGEISSRDGSRFILRYYRVFNLEQCEIPAEKLAKLPKIETRDNEPIESCARIVNEMPMRPTLEHVGGKAFYSSLSDKVTLPPMSLFASPEEYYATTFHELSHSTGHKSRLNRESLTDSAPFGSATYSKEELVAEMGAAFLCAEAGISAPVIANQAAYVAGWLKKLRDDRRLVVFAAAQAQRAADYIMGKQAGAPCALAA